MTVAGIGDQVRCFLEVFAELGKAPGFRVRLARLDEPAAVGIGTPRPAGQMRQPISESRANVQPRLEFGLFGDGCNA